MLKYIQPIESNGETDSLKLQQPKIALGAKFRKDYLERWDGENNTAVLSYDRTVFLLNTPSIE